MNHPTRWKKLTNEQLRGADYALRIMHTSTAVRGEALGVLRELHHEVTEERVSRNPAVMEAK